MKYKLHFKALDVAPLTLAKRIESFIIERSKTRNLDVDLGNIEVMHEDKLEVYFDARTLKKKFVYALDLEKYTITKGVTDYEGAEYEVSKFTLDELRFFDSLGFETDKDFYRVSTSDWWNAI